jgi:hypothetical protein
MCHTANSSETIFRGYLENWVDTTSSLESALAGRMTKDELGELRKQLAAFPEPGFYLENTNVMAGKK